MLTLAQEVADLLDQVKQTELSPLELEELDNSLGDSRGIKRSLCELTGGPQPTPAQDMEAIRFRRANAAGGNPVNVPIINTTPATTQLKVKYRKRGRGQPPTKCHSCNSRDTPEWRRGPDGARTLCNACGLHYAKLTRKREKSGGELPVIDIEMLRASARASETQLATEAKMRKTPKVRRSKDVNMLVDQTQDSPLPVATYQDPYQAMSEDSPMPPTSSPEPVQHQTIVQWGTVPTPHYRTQ
ncbi:hypothetical protein DL96DRAFT_1588394 [Flagelloscypha sp. PMI_526]|nr:hypothetical protein DL96DRAFT_1588394 [Flagelloscypha sp. PMI_526]